MGENTSFKIRKVSVSLKLSFCAEFGDIETTGIDFPGSIKSAPDKEVVKGR